MSCTTILEPTLPENGPTRGGADLYGFITATATATATAPSPIDPDAAAADDTVPGLEERDGFVFRTGPYDEWDPSVWPWQPRPWYRRDTRTGRHRRGEAPDPWPDGGEPLIRPARPCAAPPAAPHHAPPMASDQMLRAALPQRVGTRTALPHADTDGQRPRPNPGNPMAPGFVGAEQPRYRSQTPNGPTGAGKPQTPQEPESLPPLQEAAWGRFLATTESFAAAHLCATRAETGRFARLRAFLGSTIAQAFTTRATRCSA